MYVTEGKLFALVSED